MGRTASGKRMGRPPLPPSTQPKPSQPSKRRRPCPGGTGPCHNANADLATMATNHNKAQRGRQKSRPTIGARYGRIGERTGVCRWRVAELPGRGEPGRLSAARRSVSRPDWQRIPRHG